MVPLLPPAGAGGVRREGDAAEEQRHVQRRRPEPAEGQPVRLLLPFTPL